MMIFCVRINYFNLTLQVFMLAEEDKTTYISLAYWFNVIDLDSNGIITFKLLYYKINLQWL